MKKLDKILIVVLLIIGVFSIIFLNGSNKDLKKVIVKVDGVKVFEREISENQDFKEKIKTNYGYNIINVKEGKVSIISSDCTNQVCVHSGEISNEGEIIVCLPHHLIVEIINNIDNKKTEIDGFTR